ncbi:class 1b ribonucleoside-diphosphate reductase subunit alpha [Candidatus Phytoplasma citri]|uniref:Ribonucleoside-diphosphate reductase n=1 Tax=Candidatus Phytoplasma citri TaxID=180978 RepID=A0A1S9M1Q0_9MOLU|nr:class 1b ribonucleoside-diphosphate reductase subunit alpha [Candidatus Phytoplasma aurantifolia]MDO8060037.1 class 1b ribonucleoside-diphosphate reductase subunit alpha [Candidatus Phytoplasma aurantifolia]MDO8078916.1 class 1b ribonucleoside-diphosphate reductase subunit alpha [Candidatus Phytoplasma aurantifolia]OOP59072.1 ribonucleoside-diphosphate reductase subunit alpha [Candidatus Phytoplasma aurantifolia]
MVLKIVYDGLKQGNVYDFVKKLNYPNQHISEFVDNNDKIILVIKTVGFGELSQEARNFLKKYSHLVIGLASSGNKNFGFNYARSGDVASKEFGIPLIMKFEGKGFTEDVQKLNEWIQNYNKFEISIGVSRSLDYKCKNSFNNQNKFCDNNSISRWIVLNNQIIDENGNIKDLNKDLEALDSYLSEEIKPKLKKFDSLSDKLKFLIDNDYYEEDFLKLYSFDQIQEIYKIAYDYNFRFNSFMSAYKFYKDYSLKTRDKKNYLETYEDRLVINALYHSSGNFELAKQLINSLIRQNFTPATPTLLNSGLKKRGEFVSCFLLEAGDSLNDISRIIEFTMQLSKIGGGVSINLSNLRAKGESIKGIANACKGVIGVAKILDYVSRYADQMGHRLGAVAIYLSAHHADILDFLNSKKLNADDDIRLKTLSLGVVVSDKMISLAKENKMMALFYPHSIYKKYKINFADVSVEMNKWYEILVNDPDIDKKFINPRHLLETIAQLQGESGYPYIMFCDNANKQNTSSGKIKFSNLCTEILQPSVTSHYAPYDQRDKDIIGMDISCNLSSGHMGNMIKNKNIKETVFLAMELMNSVSIKSNIHYVPGVCKANRLNRSVGFGMMGHHSFLVENMIEFGSEENLELIDVFFNAVNYYSLLHSNLKAKKTGQKFFNFEQSTYASGEYFENRQAIMPKLPKIKKIFEDIELPNNEDWDELRKNIIKYGLWNSHRLAIAPNGSIGYVMSTTSSLTPIKQLVEERTYGNSKTYFPAPYLSDFSFMYQTAYQIDKFKLINVISVAQKHIDQGISLELCINSDMNTRELQKIYLYAHYKGIKTLYYTRTRKLKLSECEACSI